jgi:hypothetical protein
MRYPDDQPDEAGLRRSASSLATTRLFAASARALLGMPAAKWLTYLTYISPSEDHSSERIPVSVGDEIGLADRLTDLLANPDLARTVGECGRRFCLETRRVEVIDVHLRKLYTAAALVAV